MGLRSVNLGEYVGEGDDLVNLEDTSVLTVDFRLPERYQTRLAPGQPVQVQLDALPGRNFEAKVLAVDPLLDANGRSIAVRAVMPPTSGNVLRPGMFARVLTIFSVNDAALVVPEEAHGAAGRQAVRVPAGSGRRGRRSQDGVASRGGAARCAPRCRGAGRTGGLSVDDTVVVAGQQRLQRDGTAVRVVDMSRAGAPGAVKPAGGAASGAAPATATAAPAAPAKP